MDWILNFVHIAIFKHIQPMVHMKYKVYGGAGCFWYCCCCGISHKPFHQRGQWMNIAPSHVRIGSWMTPFLHIKLDVVMVILDRFNLVLKIAHTDSFENARWDPSKTIKRIPYFASSCSCSYVLIGYAEAHETEISVEKSSRFIICWSHLDAN